MAVTARNSGLMRCHHCGKLVKQCSERQYQPVICPRCSGHVYLRYRDSLNRTWALIVTSVILYIPANILPIMTVRQFGVDEPHTIAGGIVELMHGGLYPIALLVFIASILVPLLKMVGIFILLLSVQLNWQIGPRERVAMFRFIEFVGRWSMLDIFMISLLVALVSLGKVAEIEAGPGATAFAAVVVFTMRAAKSFDPRLIWDEINL